MTTTTRSRAAEDLVEDIDDPIEPEWAFTRRAEEWVATAKHRLDDAIAAEAAASGEVDKVRAQKSRSPLGRGVEIKAKRKLAAAQEERLTAEAGVRLAEDEVREARADRQVEINRAAWRRAQAEQASRREINERVLLAIERFEAELVEIDEGISEHNSEHRPTWPIPRPLDDRGALRAALWTMRNTTYRVERES